MKCALLLYIRTWYKACLQEKKKKKTGEAGLVEDGNKATNILKRVINGKRLLTRMKVRRG